VQPDEKDGMPFKDDNKRTQIMENVQEEVFSKR